MIKYYYFSSGYIQDYFEGTNFVDEELIPVATYSDFSFVLFLYKKNKIAVEGDVFSKLLQAYPSDIVNLYLCELSKDQILTSVFKNRDSTEFDEELTKIDKDPRYHSNYISLKSDYITDTDMIFELKSYFEN